MNITSSLIILLILCMGFGYYIFIAQKRKSSRVEKFFVGGRNIGFPLFTQTTWGSSFAFGNSIFYAIWLGYALGLSALWFQALWALGMFIYGLLLPRLVLHTQNYTLHGFLGSHYGNSSRIVASLISTIGLIILLGFEISFAAQFFTQITNLQHLEWLVVLVLSIFIVTFCSIGGYSANVLTDKITNRLAFILLFALLSMIIFNNQPEILDVISTKRILDSLTDFSSSNWVFLTGLAFFSLFNIVDMSNWQNVSANSLDVNDKYKQIQMKKAMFKAAGLFLITPVFVGTIIGYLIKILGQGTDDQSVFMSTFVFNLLPIATILFSIIIGIITFIFLASSLTGADSWLLACAQTISWDFIDYKKFKEFNFKIENFDEQSHQYITRRGRIILMIIGIIGTLSIYYISKYIWGEVFALQFIIFGGGLALLPALIYGILKNNPTKSNRLSKFTLMSFILGYGSALIIFIYSLFIKNPDIVNSVPIVSLGVSGIVFLIGLLYSKFGEEKQNE
jgi:Na+/proline symporter